MADNNYITTVTEKGSVCISEDVIATIVGAAIKEIDGVDGLASTVGDDIMEFVGLKNLAKGVKVSFAGDKIIVDILLMVNFGCVVTEVAENVQSAVANALESMTGCPSTVNVHVSGITFPRLKA
ncbi:MAG: Asp23/Gls24 family envelope stress response protein [Oscillospiraceae bacterium]